MHFLVAWRAFWRTLFNDEMAERVETVLHGAPSAAPALPEPQKPQPEPAKPRPAEPKPPVRSEALTLLATLQREGRLIDFLKEPIASYTDAQIGAVVRDIHRDCGKVLDRLFAIEPVLTDAEGAEVEVPAGFDAGRYRLVGNVTGDPPFRGRLTHHGWTAGKSELPAWQGSPDSARVVAPAEIEL